MSKMTHPAALPEAGAPPAPDAAHTAGPGRGERFYRHRLPVRVMHWINVVCLAMLLMSGLTIFNAHPALYWGKDSSFAAPWLSIGAERRDGQAVGVTRIGGATFATDGV